MSVAATKFQKGEERYILRSQIKEDPTIPASLGRGRKSVSAPLSKSTACSEPSSGTSVLETSFLGHQRLKALDYNEKFRRPGIISSA